jgi:putative aldouronate transport system permease protein
MNTSQIKVQENIVKAPAFRTIFRKDFAKNKELYLLVVPVILFYILFHYKPIYGALIAFKEYSPVKGVMGSPWVGLKHFKDFLGSYYFVRILKNTVVISFTTLLFGFPAPIILALLMNEIRSKVFGRWVQTISYLPHFISLVVICGMIKDFTTDTGVLSYVVKFFGGEGFNMLNVPKLFVPIYVGSGIWQEIGFGSIVYLAALAGIDQEQYEAAALDGAGRWRQTLHVTIPGILPTIVVLFILRIGNMLNVGFEKVILLYNPVVYETADVISSFVYRKGLQEFSFSFSSAVGLFNSVINFILVVSANWISRKVNETSLW